MAKKPLPKYPHRGRLIRRRLLSQAFLLLCAAGVIGFYYYIKTSDPDEHSTLYRLGESIGMAGKERPAAALPAEGKNGAIPPPPVPDKPQPAPTKPLPEPSPGMQAPLAAQTQPPISPPPREDAADSPADSPEDNAGAAAVRDTAQEAEQEPSDSPLFPDADDLPFTGLSLAEVAAKLAARYAGTGPGQWGERVPGVVTRLNLPAAPAAGEEENAPARTVVALTFDACGGGKDGYDAELIAFLRERRIPATLFVTSLWLRKNPEILRELADDPLFEIAAHGERHRPCSINGKSVYGIKGTANMAELVQEVLGNAREIKEATGAAPRWFRSGTAFYDETAVRAIHDLGMGVAGYSIAGDQGATLSASRVAGQTLKARHGDILLYHMNKPRSGTREGLKKALPELLQKGVRFVRLSEAY